MLRRYNFPTLEPETIFLKKPSKFMKNAFYFMLKTLLFLFWSFVHQGERIDKKASLPGSLLQG